MKKNKNYVDLTDQPVPEGQHLLEVDVIPEALGRGPADHGNGRSVRCTAGRR